ncbi:tyrosinase family protein [Reichenbachiella versicolor]|uniref:tyrosinase family protein n=1 Tax=Reichenbachiella versicolor TaxID=1821036 RepID=UPI0013A532F6|nr:tyrosinase family protein [Reichenbachiella versicolor]
MNQIHKWVLSGIIICSLVLVANAQVTRKNIDQLTPEELGAYEHAIQLLRDRSAKNPYLLDGYAWQAWVHNKNRVSVPKKNTLKQGKMNPTRFYEKAASQTYSDGTYGYPGMCEHGKDIFLVWHRAQFYYFEQILQNTDPEGTIVDSKGNKYPTKDIGVPYWNFTQKPSGKKFPKAYENKKSVLFHEGRNLENNPEYKEFTSPELLASLLDEPDWPTFGGYVNATNGGYGTFEAQMHNPMHTPFIGGDMTYPSRAAYDPIFYSFHSYIDYVFEAWIERHGTDDITSTDYFLRAEQPQEFNLPDFNPGMGDRPNMGQAKLYFDIKKLGYQFKSEPDDTIYTKQQIETFLQDENGMPLELAKSDLSPYYKLFYEGVSRKPEATVGKLITNDVTVKPASKKQPYLYTYTEPNASSSYQIDLYMHPKKVKAEISSEKFRKKYFVATSTAWLDPEHHHGSNGMMDHKLNVDLTKVMNDLDKNFDKQAFQLTINHTKL